MWVSLVSVHVYILYAFLLFFTAHSSCHWDFIWVQQVEGIETLMCECIQSGDCFRRSSYRLQMYPYTFSSSPDLENCKLVQFVKRNIHTFITCLSLQPVLVCSPCLWECWVHSRWYLPLGLSSVSTLAKAALAIDCLCTPLTSTRLGSVCASSH